MSHRYVLGRAAMVDWSDRGPARAPVPAEWSAADRAPQPRGARRPAAGGAALTALVEHARLGGHVLVAGCVDADVLTAVAAHADRVTVLVRGTVDAEQVEALLPSATVICGDLADLAAAVGGADAAVLLDGLDRIATVESAPDSWSDRLGAVLTLVAAGPVLLTVANPLSPAALGRGPGERGADSDADWDPVDRSAPATLSAVLAALPASVVLSAFGEWARPTLLLPTGVAVPGSGLAALALAHTGTGGRLDERATLRLAADAGHLDAHAPAWVLVPGPSPATPAGVPGGILFEEAFLDACADLDAGGARALLHAAAAFLATAPALPHTLVVDPLGAVAALPVPAPDVEDRPVAFCAALADRLLQLGVRRPWPLAADRVELTALLTAAAGHDLPTEVVAASMPAIVPEPTPDAAGVAAEHDVAVRDRERAYVELIDVLETRAVQAEDRAQQRTEELKTARARLARVREELAAVRGSRSFRIGRAVTAPLRRARGGPE